MIFSVVSHLYQELKQTKSEEEAFAIVLSGSRDHARAMMDWKWAARQRKEKDSVYSYCKKLAKLRKKTLALSYGEIMFTNQKKKNIFSYYREMDGENIR